MKLSKIRLSKLKILRNSKGDILKYLNKKNPYLKSFGETYFTEIKKNKIKGWNFHKKNFCFLAVPYGKVRFTFTENLKSKKIKIIILGKKNYNMILLPPKIWFKFTSLTKISLIVNTLNKPHNDKETLKGPLN